MSKLVMLRGLPASGKSTYAKKLIEEGGNWVRVNRDLIRTMLHFDKWTPNNEDITVKAEVAIAMEALNNNVNVVVDDTNLGNRHHRLWSGVAKDLGVKFEVVDDFEKDIGKLILRDAKREKRVTGTVIKNMAMQYNMIPGIEDVVVCDIDGTLADCNHRKHHLEGKEKDWDGFFSDMLFDTLRKDVYDRVVEESANKTLVLVSARPEEYRSATEIWLRKNNVSYTHLLMRPNNDCRPDTDVKKELYSKYLKHYNVTKVFDDRPAVIRMWREQGLEVEDVGDGEEF